MVLQIATDRANSAHPRDQPSFTTLRCISIEDRTPGAVLISPPSLSTISDFGAIEWRYPTVNGHEANFRNPPRTVLRYVCSGIAARNVRFTVTGQRGKSTRCGALARQETVYGVTPISTRDSTYSPRHIGVGLARDDDKFTFGRGIESDQRSITSVRNHRHF